MSNDKVMPRVALIDSGVDVCHPLLRAHADRIRAFTVDGSGAVNAGAPRDPLGHGTAVAAVLLSLAPDCELISIAVFDQAQAGAWHSSPERVAAALRCAQTLQPAVANISLGFVAQTCPTALVDAIVALAACDCAMVAPATAQGLPCWPGQHPAVHAVSGDPAVAHEAPVATARPTRIAPVWRANPLPPPSLAGLASAVRGASLAAACVSAALVQQRNLVN